MIKSDATRDYATEAFRYYAALGKPTYEQLKQQLYDEILRKQKRELIRVSGISNPTQNAQINAEREVERRTPELLDILAVEKTLDLLHLGNKPEIIRCIECVYFPEPSRPIKRGEITERVSRACTEVYASERQIYYWLKQARQLFAAERGLRF